jgi:hypothetical protein
MGPTAFDILTRSLHRTPSRRTALHSKLGGIAMAVAGQLSAPPGSVPAAKKKHRKKKCPQCPPCVCPPPPPPFCAGKDNCMQTQPCGTSGSTCYCHVRFATGGPICGVFAKTGTTCADCDVNSQVCARGGGFCSDPILCITPCPNPL